MNGTGKFAAICLVLAVHGAASLSGAKPSFADDVKPCSVHNDTTEETL